MKCIIEYYPKGLEPLEGFSGTAEEVIAQLKIKIDQMLNDAPDITTERGKKTVVVAARFNCTVFNQYPD